MDFSIKRRPPPLMDIISIHFLPLFFIANRMQKKAFPETNHTQSQTNIKHTWRRKTPSKATSSPIFVSKAPLRIHPQPHWDVDEGGRSHLQPQAGSPIHAVQGILPCKLNYRSLPLSATFTAF